MKNSFVTVLIKTYSYEVEVAIILLDSNDIECFVHDENTINIIPFYSNALGGIQLKVKRDDFEISIKTLSDFGFLHPNDGEIYRKREFHEQENDENYIKIQSKISQNYSLFRQFKTFIWPAIIISTLFVSLIYSTYKSEENIESEIYELREDLLYKRWEINKFTYNLKEIQPNSINITTNQVSYYKKEFIIFTEEDIIILPGFETNQVEGKYLINGNELLISYVDTFKNIYEGTFQIELHNNQLKISNILTNIEAEYE